MIERAFLLLLLPGGFCYQLGVVVIPNSNAHGAGKVAEAKSGDVSPPWGKELSMVGLGIDFYKCTSKFMPVSLVGCQHTT